MMRRKRRKNPSGWPALGYALAGAGLYLLYQKYRGLGDNGDDQPKTVSFWDALKNIFKPMFSELPEAQLSIAPMKMVRGVESPLTQEEIKSMEHRPEELEPVTGGDVWGAALRAAASNAVSVDSFTPPELLQKIPMGVASPSPADTMKELHDKFWQWRAQQRASEGVNPARQAWLRETPATRRALAHARRAQATAQKPQAAAYVPTVPIMQQAIELAQGRTFVSTLPVPSSLITTQEYGEQE